jgi:hypothetical protein
MTQPYGQQPGNYGQQPGGYPQAGAYPQTSGYPQSGPPSGGFPAQSYPQAPGYAQGAGGLPQSPPEYGRGGPIEKPGAVTGAAVLAFIQAGITLITTGIVFIVLATAEGIATDMGVSLGGSLAEGWIIAFVQLAGVVMLIFGAVQLMSGTSRGLLLAAVGLEVAISLYYLIRALSASGDSATAAGYSIVVPLLFAIMPAIALILALGGATGQYLAAKQRGGY